MIPTSEVVPKLLIFTLEAFSFEDLRALGFSDGRFDTALLGTRERSVPLGDFSLWSGRR